MEGIEIRTNMEEPEGKRRPAAFFLFLTAGVFGILTLFQSLKGISFSEGIVYPAAALLCWGIWFTYYGSRRAYLVLVSGAVAVYGYAVFRMEDVLREQIRYIAHCVTGGVSLEPIDVTEAALLLTELLTFFMAMSEFLIRSHTLLYLMTTLLLLLSPLLGIRVGAGTVFLLALFQVSFAVMQTDGTSVWRMSFEGAGTHGISGRGSILAGAVLAGGFLVLFPAVALWTEELYAFVYEAESRVSRTMDRLSGRDSRTVAGGDMAGGNNYRSGTPHLELEADEKPTENLYLRGFEGSEYTGRGWTDSSDGEVFRIVERKLGWNGYFAVGNLYDSMYFVMNGNIQDREPPVWRNLLIRHADGDYGNMYTPYYSQQGVGWDGGVQDGYVYRYYEQQDMDIVWDQVYGEFDIIRDWYLELRDAYADEIQGVYTRVPVQILPRLSALCHNNPQGSLEEITAFILYTLQDSAGYTLTPGRTPLNEDIVEYFLFENRKGYCEHFAAAATLMYRLYGIPARYAAGYMVQPSAFGRQEDGLWKAVVTDEAAHAWVEIFLEDYGWTPVEVTPSGDGDSGASYPGFDNVLFRQLVAEKGWNLAGWEPSPGEGDLSGEKGSMEGELSAFSMDYEKYEKWLWLLGALGAYSLCLLPFFLDYRRLKGLKKMESWDSRRVFSRVLEMLRFAGMLSGYDGTETDFASRLAQESGVPEEVLAGMQEIVTEAAYGFSEISPEAEARVRETYLLLAQGIYGKLKWRRRLLFRYWKGFF